MFGLSYGDANQSYNSIDYAVYTPSAGSGSIVIYEAGTKVYTHDAQAQLGDVVKVQRDGYVITYHLNDQVIYTSSTLSKGDLHLDTSINYLSARFDNVQMVQNHGQQVASQSLSYNTVPLAISLSDSEIAAGESSIVTFTFAQVQEAFDASYVQVDGGALSNFNDVNGDGRVWTASFTPGYNVVDASNIIRVSINEQGLAQQPVNLTYSDTTGLAVDSNTGNMYKTNDGSWNAGGFSNESIAGDGSVALVLATIGGSYGARASKMFGLSAADDGQSYTTIDYAWFVENGSLKVYEKGVARANAMKANVGDVLQVRRVDGIVEYLQNGEVMYTSNVASGDVPLYLDTSVQAKNGILEQVTMVNGSMIIASDNYTIDNQPLTIAMADESLTVGESTEVTFVFASAQPDFELAHIVADGGEVSDLSSTDNVTWTATFTPTEGINDTSNAISVGLSSSGAPATTVKASFSDATMANWQGNSIASSTSEYDQGNTNESLSGDGFIAAQYDFNVAHMQYGLTTTGDGSVNYGFSIRESVLLIIESTTVDGVLQNAQEVATVGVIVDGDSLKVARVGEEMLYYLNEQLVYTSQQTAPTGDLYGAFNLWDSGLAMTNVVLSEAVNLVYSDNYVVDTQVLPLEQSVSGNQIQLSYHSLNADSVPAATDFIVSVSDEASPRTVTDVAINGSAVTITFDGAAIENSDSVSFEYQPGSNPLQSANGYDASGLTMAVFDDAANTYTASDAGGIVVGNGGDDFFIGSSGTDIYDFNTLADGNDTIQNFVPRTSAWASTMTDKLDLSDILDYEVGDDLAQFIQVVDQGDGNDVLVNIDVDGGSLFAAPDMTITLAGIGTGRYDLASIADETFIVL